MRVTEAEGQGLHRRTRDPKTKPRTRDRLEMLRLADAGGTAPQISRHLYLTPRRVRFWLKRFPENLTRSRANPTQAGPAA